MCRIVASLNSQFEAPGARKCILSEGRTSVVHLLFPCYITAHTELGYQSGRGRLCNRSLSLARQRSVPNDIVSMMTEMLTVLEMLNIRANNVCFPFRMVVFIGQSSDRMRRM